MMDNMDNNKSDLTSQYINDPIMTHPLVSDGGSISPTEQPHTAIDDTEDILSAKLENLSVSLPADAADGKEEIGRAHV